MSARVAFVSVALLIVSGAAHSQPQPKPTPLLPGGPNIPPTNLPSTPPVTVPTPPPPPSIDDLLNELERVQVQRAELEKKEKELKAAIRKKLEAQAERLKKLDIAPVLPKLEPDRVGKIIIEGNTKTPDQKILDRLEFRPGQLLHYPALDAARAKLEKAGFRGVTVEVVPGELDSNYKDVRVKVDESKPMPDPLPR